MQSTGQTSTQEVSFVPMQGSLITYAKGTLPMSLFHRSAVRNSITERILYIASLWERDARPSRPRTRRPTRTPRAGARIRVSTSHVTRETPPGAFVACHGIFTVQL